MNIFRARGPGSDIQFHPAGTVSECYLEFQDSLLVGALFILRETGREAAHFLRTQQCWRSGLTGGDISA
jgi:hypothetical protein